MSLLDDDEYDIPAPRMGAKFWKATKLVEMDDILYFGLRIHSPEGIKQRLEIVAEKSLQQPFKSKTSIEASLETNCGRRNGRIASCGRQTTAVTATFNSSGSATGALCRGTLPVRTMLSRLRNTENTVSPQQVRAALLSFARSGLDANPDDETHVAAYVACRKMMDRVSGSAFRQYLNSHKKKLTSGSR